MFSLMRAAEDLDGHNSQTATTAFISNPLGAEVASALLLDVYRETVTSFTHSHLLVQQNNRKILKIQSLLQVEFRNYDENGSIFFPNTVQR